MAGREVREYKNPRDPKDKKWGKGRDKIDDEDITFQRMVAKGLLTTMSVPYFIAAPQPRRRNQAKKSSGFRKRCLQMAVRKSITLLENVVAIFMGEVLDATDNEPWGPHGTALAQFSNSTALNVS